MLRQPFRRGSDSLRYRLPGSLSALRGAAIESAGQLAYRLGRDGIGPDAALLLCDPDGVELFRIDAPGLHLRDSLSIQSESRIVAVIRKVLEPPFREEFRVDAPGDHVWRATGRIAASVYAIREGTDTVASVKATSTAEGGGLDVLVAETANPALALIVVVAINELAAPRVD